MENNFKILAPQVREFASSHDNIIAIYIFGSAAIGKMRPSGDIDIAVMSTRRIDGFAKAELETELSMLLHRDVDRVVFHQADVLLQHQILKYGHLVYENDISERVIRQWSADVLG